MGSMLLRGGGFLTRPLFRGCPRSGPWSGPLSLVQTRLHSRQQPDRLTQAEEGVKARPLGKGQRRKLLPDTPCRTRFAPSPTGTLHLGSLRTALFNYLLARATGGQFVLRIEDTDQRRVVPGAEASIFADLHWAGLSWDEGPDVGGKFGSYRQSERLPIYKEHADQLLQQGKAYRCFCPPDEPGLTSVWTDLHGTLPASSSYPGTCREISRQESDERASKGDKFCIRLKCSPEGRVLRDLVYDRRSKREPEPDFILLKRDGFPTYHFANVVDDHLMSITHVLRGAEWLTSTTLHLELYEAFGWEPPSFAHLPLLVNEDRKKLSKRMKSAGVAFYRDGLILPSALLNFCGLLGLGTTFKNEVMTLQGMVDTMGINFTKGNVTVPLRNKLPYLQRQHLERLANDSGPHSLELFEEYVRQPIRRAFCTDELDPSRAQISPESLGDRMIKPGILEDRFRPELIRFLVQTPMDTDDMVGRFRDCVWKYRYYFFDVPEAWLERLLRDNQLEPGVKRDQLRLLSGTVSRLADKLAAVDEAGGWNREALDAAVREVAAESRAHPPDTAQGTTFVYTTLRWALMAMMQSLPMAHTMVVLGKAVTLERLEKAKRAAECVVAHPTPASAPDDSEHAVEGGEPAQTGQ